MTSIKFCRQELGMNKNTTVNWNSYMREIYADYMNSKNKKKICGDGLVVEIDESMFSKRKANIG